MKKLLLTTLLILLLPVWAGAATYNWYFSDDATGNAAGNDTTGDGSIGTPWKTLAKAKTQIDAVNSDDIVNLFFDRSDIWSVATGQNSVFTVWNSDPIVNIDAYGTGDRPIFDGGITDFSAVAVSGTGGYYFYNELFVFQKNNCSMKNIEIKRIYGVAIRLGSSSSTTNKGDYFTLSDCYIHHFGYGGITIGLLTGASNCTIEKNVMHTGQELYRHEKVPWWNAAINLFEEIIYPSNDNLVRYNVIYDIYGEGIQGAGGIIEYNIVGDTGSVGIYPVPSKYNAEDTIVRYNFIIQSSSATYSNMSGSTYHGITYFDENSAGGDNSNATIEIYGNIIINRKVGIKIYNGDGLGEIRVFNNTIIDSVQGNLVVDDVEEFNAAYIYNNTSILYDRTGATHVADYSNLLPHANWTIENNHFWTTGGFDCTTDLEYAGFDDYCKDGDPKLAGEEQGSPVDWDGQSGATYYKDITIADVTPNSESGLINTGLSLGAGFATSFLTTGTDFGDLPGTVTFVTASQIDYLPWDIGAYVYKGSGPAPSGNWGITAATTGWAVVNEVYCRCMGGTTPATANLTLGSIKIFNHTTHTSQLRVAVYQGGALDTGPVGATLIAQGSTAGAATDGYISVAMGNEALASSTVTWVCAKGNDAGFGVAYSNSSADAGDFQTATGRFRSANSSDEDIAYAAAWPADAGTFNTAWFGYYIVYGGETPASPTITAIGTATVAAGVATFTANRTPGAAITAEGNPGWYYALKLSERLEVYASPSPAVLRWDCGPAAAYADAIYYGHLKDASDYWYLLFDPNLASPQRITHPQAYGDGSASIIINDSTFKDGDDNALATNFSGLGVDFDGTGEIIIAIAKADWSLTSGGDYATFALFDTATHSVPDDEFVCNFTGPLNTDAAGTSGHVIEFNGSVVGDVTVDQEYVTVEDMTITGTLNVSAANTIIQRVKILP